MREIFGNRIQEGMDSLKRTMEESAKIYLNSVEVIDRALKEGPASIPDVSENVKIGERFYNDKMRMKNLEEEEIEDVINTISSLGLGEAEEDFDF